MSRRVSRSGQASPMRGGWRILGLLPIGLALGSFTGARADETRPAGVWVSERGSDRLFLALYADGRYRMARARAAAGAPLAVQSDAGSFVVGTGWVTLSPEPGACGQPLGGAFRFRFAGRHLRLEGERQTYTFGRLPAHQAELTAGSGPPVFGCFEGDRFVPTVPSSVGGQSRSLPRSGA